jgi:3-oxoacyl-[acyl-carrier-protein] synthase II
MRRLDRASRMLLWAAHEAWQQSGWEPSPDLPVVLGTTSGGMSFGEVLPSDREWGRGRARTGYAGSALSPAHAGTDAPRGIRVPGPITILANACASGANALGHAWEMLCRGRVERVLAGGYDALSLLVYSGFDSLQAVSPTRCRPFETGRDG